MDQSPPPRQGSLSPLRQFMKKEQELREKYSFHGDPLLNQDILVPKSPTKSPRKKHASGRSSGGGSTQSSSTDGGSSGKDRIKEVPNLLVTTPKKRGVKKGGSRGSSSPPLTAENFDEQINAFLGRHSRSK